MRTNLHSYCKKTCILLWVFFIALGSSAIAQTDSVSDLVFKLVHFPEIDPLGPSIRPEVLKKLDVAGKKAEWTRTIKPDLDSLELRSIDLQVRTLIRKLNVSLVKRAFIDSIIGSKSLEVKHKNSKKHVSISFAQARVTDPSIDEKDIRSRLADANLSTPITKKEQGGIILNIERIAEFGTWHPQYKQLLAAKPNEVIGPFMNEEPNTRVFLKLFEREEYQKSADEKQNDKSAEIDSIWRAYVGQLMYNSTLNKIELQKSYFNYRDNAKILSPNDTLAKIDSIVFKLSDLYLSQKSYERFVLNPDTSDFLHNLRSYLISPILLNNEAPFQPGPSFRSRLKAELEVKFRSSAVYSDIVNNISITDEDVEHFYASNQHRFTSYGTCSYLVAYLHDDSKDDMARSQLISIFNSGEFDPEMKRKENGFTVKFEEGFNLDQKSRLADTFLNMEVGKPALVSDSAEGGSAKCVLMTDKSAPVISPLNSVREQILSELAAIRITEIEEQFSN